VRIKIIAIAIGGCSGNSAKIIAINCNYLQLFTQIYNELQLFAIIEMQLIIAKFLIIAIMIA